MVECDAFGADGSDSSFGPTFGWKPLAGSPVGKPGGETVLAMARSEGGKWAT